MTSSVRKSVSRVVLGASAVFAVVGCARPMMLQSATAGSIEPTAASEASDALPGISGLDSIPAASFDSPEATQPSPSFASTGETRTTRSSESKNASKSKPKYLLLSDVTLTREVERRLDRLAATYFAKTGKPLVVTSGARDPDGQAEAMFRILELGGDLIRLYNHKDAARAIQRVYDAGKSKGRSADEIVGDMASLIRSQIDRGVFVSAHLKAGAVDVRNRDMSVSDKRALLQGVAEMGDVDVLEESTPPHFHLEFE